MVIVNSLHMKWSQDTMDHTLQQLSSSRILVIRLGALGDLVMCFAAFNAIRAAHPHAKIALLTGAAFANFARLMPWFDEVIIDPRPACWNVPAWWRLVSRVQRFAPTHVFDLQGKRRQNVLFHLLDTARHLRHDKEMVWSGAAKGCSHPRPWPPRPDMHWTEFLAAQLAAAGVPHVAADSKALAWLDAPLNKFALPPRYALLIAGCSPQHPHKRWLPRGFAELADRLADAGIVSLAIGTHHDAAAIAAITALSCNVVNLTGKTTLPELAALARGATCVIGNDTGPVHVAAAVGARVVALLSGKTNKTWSSPCNFVGENEEYVHVLQAHNIADISVEEVWQGVEAWVMV